MKLLLIITIAIMPVTAVCQSPAAEKFWGAWIEDLHAMGVETKNDSLIVKQEVVKLFTDTLYRKSVYPAAYTWQEAVNSLRDLDLKKAFWYMLNIYETDSVNRSYVLGTFVAYDSIMNMDKILLSTYYTYAFADPRVSRVKNNKPDIFRPDLLEKGLSRVKDIIAQVWYYRDRRNARVAHPGR